MSGKSSNLQPASAARGVVSKLAGSIPPACEISRNSPLRLHIAAALAFPDGSMKVSGLRREANRGRLVIERVAGKDYTTLQAIDEMRKLCRDHPKVPDCGLNRKSARGG
jgi:hypothetical protein